MLGVIIKKFDVKPVMCLKMAGSGLYIIFTAENLHRYASLISKSK